MGSGSRRVRWARKSKSHAIGRYADPEEARDTEAGPASGASWVVTVLAGINEKPLFERWDQKRSEAGNAEAARHRWPVLVCPSRRAGGGLIAACDLSRRVGRAAGTDYAACNGFGNHL